MKQKILFPILGENKEIIRHTIKLPKIIRNVSAFEMQFGMKQPVMTSANKTKGLETKELIYDKYY